MDRIERLRYSRRELLGMGLGISATTALPVGFTGGCRSLDSMWSGPLPPVGDLLSPNRDIGHRLRDRSNVSNATAQTRNTIEPPQTYRCVIVGGGVAGLSAAWHLKRSGIEDFVVLEMESDVGGTSRSGTRGDFQFPWGAHYLPVPRADNKPLIAFLTSCGMVETIRDGEVIVREEYLCRDPEERVFADGQWWAGLTPEAIMEPGELELLNRFSREIFRWSERTGEDGKPFFTLPTRRCSGDEPARQLDRISFADWLNENNFRSPTLDWLVDYACRDDYGLTADQTSAWAGLFYFAARVRDERGQSQDVMTWPQGNGYLVDQLRAPIASTIRTNQAVMRVTRASESLYEVHSLDTQTMSESVLHAEHVILAVPQFIGRRLIGDAIASAPRYGSWIVANAHVSSRPVTSGFPMAWDNVTRQSRSLGYVNSTHQTGRDHGPVVLTWYMALPEPDPAQATEQATTPASIPRGPSVREKLMTLTWSEAAEMVISDLEMAHPAIRAFVTRLDVMVWGHAMVQPFVGTIFDPARRSESERIGNVHFACTDLSGIALFEEAFDHGRRAAAEV